MGLSGGGLAGAGVIVRVAGGDVAAGAASRWPPPSLTAVVDGVTAFAVLAFAAWTIVYDFGLLFGLGTSVLLMSWAALLAVLAAVAGMFRQRRGRGAAGGMVAGPRLESAGASKAPGPVRRYLAVGGVISALAAAVATGMHSAGVAWAWTWLLGSLSVAATSAAVLMRNVAPGPPAPGSQPAPARAQVGSLLALCTAVGAALFSLYVVRPDGDDAYFISRSVWTAEHGRIPVRDVLFTNQAVGAGNGEPPVASIEVLNGALARLLGVHAASFTYYISLPVATFMAVWATWLLIRRWAPRRALPCFAVAMVYLLWSGASRASFGGFHLVRMWQGKAAFVSIMVPLLYAYLTQWAEHRSRRALALVLASSIAAVGLSSTAVMIVPLVTAAAVVPLLLARKIKIGLLAALAVIYPLAAGLVTALRYPVPASASVPMPPTAVWAWVMLSGVLGGIGAAALWLSPWLVRGGTPALITTGIAAAATALLVPGVIAAISDVTGAGVVSWRLLWLVPGPVLAGMLAAAPVPAAPRAALHRVSPAVAGLPALAVCALILAAGVPIWSYQSAYTMVAKHPSWKYHARPLALARDVLRADHRPGYILSTQRIMSAIPLITTRRRAVDPRDYYLNPAGLPVGREFVSARRLLTGMAQGKQPMPSAAAVRAALARVGVGYACVWRSNPDAIKLLEQAGYIPVTHFHSLECLD